MSVLTVPLAVQCVLLGALISQGGGGGSESNTFWAGWRRGKNECSVLASLEKRQGALICIS